MIFIQFVEIFDENIYLLGVFEEFLNDSNAFFEKFRSFILRELWNISIISRSYYRTRKLTAPNLLSQIPNLQSMVGDKSTPGKPRGR